jgi:hypothetical protein
MKGNRPGFPDDRPRGREEKIIELKKKIRLAPNDMDLATALASYYTDGL